MPGKIVEPGSPLDLSEEEKEKLPENPQAAGSKASIITLKGLAVTESGEVTRSKYFNILNTSVDDYSDIQFTPEEAKQVRNTMLHLSTGTTASMPVTCTPACPWKARCVYEKLGKAPYGRQCLVELNIMKNAQMRYLEEYDVDPLNYTEWTMVNQLAEIEVMLWRINQNLVEDPQEASGVVEQTVGIDNQGNAITQKQISQFYELQDKLYNRKDKLVKRLVGDRQEKYKMQAALKKVDDKDASTSMADIRQKIESASRALDVLASKKATPAQLLEKTTDSESVESTPASGDSPLSPDDITVGEENND